MKACQSLADKEKAPALVNTLLELLKQDDNINYILSYNPATREWTSTEDPGPSISVDKLAQLVQKSFGVFV